MKTTPQFLLPLLLLGATTLAAQAQPMFSRITPSQGPDCATSFPVQILGSNVVTGTYTVTLTDYSSVPRAASSIMVDPNQRFLNVIFDLTGLSDGLGSITEIAPDLSTYTFPFTITSCPGGSGMQVRLYGASTIGLLRTWQYVVSVINMGPTPTTSSPADVQVDGLAAAPDMTVTPPTGSGPAILPTPPPTEQGFTVSVPALNVGQSADFVFEVAPGGSSPGNTYSVGAHFTTVYSGSDSLPVTVIASMDPNDKTGPPGIGAARYLTGNPRLAYNIAFENEDTATAPAQRVVITDQLDPAKVDINSFLFGPITFGSELVTPTLAQNPFSITHACNVQGNDLWVQIDGNLDVDSSASTYGQVTWTFQTLDPNTGLPPTSASIGFLPPDSSPPEGQGAVSFTLSEVPGLVTGDIITNRATVVFDLNAAITTPTWTNTIVKATPLLTIENAGNQVKITWAAWVLQQADALSGTGPGSWSDAPVQTSPWIFTPTEQKKFYRLRTPD